MTAVALAAAPKLAKLIPLLGSDKDGEVVAAARAIGRALQSAKADWHDLVRVLTDAPDTDTDNDLPFILRCLHGHPALTEWESKFIASIVQQQARERSLSDKQRATVLRAWERLQ
jgi:hypothetical protein